jgi:hypothetical protein
MNAMTGGTFTFLFTDIEGSTRRWGQPLNRVTRILSAGHGANC